jgi:putative ABC transport system permease protein
MILSEFSLIAIKNVQRRKLRAFLTIIGIIISIAAIFILISVSFGLQNAIEEQFRMLGSDKFFIQPRANLGPPGSSNLQAILTRDDTKVVEKVSGVKKVAEMIISPSKIEFKSEIRFANVIGLNLETAKIYFETGLAGIDQGRLLDKNDKGLVLVGSYYKEAKFFTKPMLVGDKFLIKDKEFRVKGILKPIGNPVDDKQIYMPEEDFRTLFNIPDRIDALMIQVESGSNLNQIASNVEKKLTSSRGQTEKTRDFLVQTPEELLSGFGTVLNVITAFLIGVAAISLLVGAIGIANTMFTSVLERTKEIGIMKAVGAKNSTILALFVIESGLLGIIGGIIGVILGIGATKIIEYIALSALGSSLLKIEFPIYLIVGCIAFAFLTGAISGAWPAWRATKIKPVEALRYE